MYYSTWEGELTHLGIGIARSENLTDWTVIGDFPETQPCEQNGTWNSCESGHPCTFRDDDGQAYLFYQGSPDMGETWYLSKVKIAFDTQHKPYIQV